MTERYANLAVVDIQQFGTRTDYVQTLLRRRLNEILDSSLSAAGVDPGGPMVDRVDRGDGVALILDTRISKQVLTGPFVEALAEELRRHAITSLPMSSIRLRLSLHAGEVSSNQGGYSGSDLNAACRLVDIEMLRDVLAATPTANLVVGLSDEWHTAVIKNDWADGSDYTTVPFVSKEIHSWAHVRVPGHPAPAGGPGSDDGSDPEPGQGSRPDTGPRWDPGSDGGPKPAGGPRRPGDKPPYPSPSSVRNRVSNKAGRDIVNGDSIRTTYVRDDSRGGEQ